MEINNLTISVIALIVSIGTLCYTIWRDYLNEQPKVDVYFDLETNDILSRKREIILHLSIFNYGKRPIRLLGYGVYYENRPPDILLRDSLSNNKITFPYSLEPQSHLTLDIKFENLMEYLHYDLESIVKGRYTRDDFIEKWIQGCFQDTNRTIYTSRHMSNLGMLIQLYILRLDPLDELLKTYVGYKSDA